MCSWFAFISVIKEMSKPRDGGKKDRNTGNYSLRKRKGEVRGYRIRPWGEEREREREREKGKEGKA